MDVRGVLRRARLPLVASLFLALLGGPVGAPPAPLPVSVPAVSQAAPSSLVASSAPAAPADDASSAPVVAAAPAFPAIPQLSGQAVGSAAAPRAPPVRA